MKTKKYQRKDINTINRLLRASSLVIGLILLYGCTSNIENNATSPYKPQNSPLAYDLQEPDDTYQLNAILEEISGISFINENEIACIQDEDGILFIYNITKREITSEIKFGKKGDYEDVSIINDDAYILRSDGTIVEIKNYLKQSPEISFIKTPLSQRNDTEGMCYDPAENYLLIACKGDPFIDGNSKNKAVKAVYAYDQVNRKLIKEEPIYQIHLKEIQAPQEEKGIISAFFVKMARKSKIASDYLWFNPSGIAIDPFNNNNVFILSDKGKYIILLSKTSGAVYLEKLSERLFTQAEGIAFNQNGDLFISNESGGGGNILRFNVKKMKKNRN